MSKTARIISFVLAGAVVGMALLFLLRPGELEYEGKTVEQWAGVLWRGTPRQRAEVDSHVKKVVLDAAGHCDSLAGPFA